MREPLSDCDWMLLHFEALFDHDPRGRITARREPGHPAAPRFQLGRTPHGNLWRFRSDLPSELVSGLSRLAAREIALPRTSSAPPPPERLKPMRDLLEARAALEREWRGPAFRFDSTREGLRALRTRAAGTRVLDSGAGDVADSLAERFPRLAATLELRAPCCALLEQGRVVCVCYAAAGARDLALEAGVETVPEHRGRGLAARCVAGWAIAVLERGATPLYSTSWQNAASLALARAIDLIPYGEDLQLD